MRPWSAGFGVLLSVASLASLSCVGTVFDPAEPGRGAVEGGRGGSGGAGGSGGGRPDTAADPGPIGGAAGGPTEGEGGAADAGSGTLDAKATEPEAGPVGGGPPPLVGGKFRHPGILVNRAQLQIIRDKVNAGAQPWKAAYDRAMQDRGSLTRNPSPRAVVECGAYSNPNLGCSDEIDDASTAYVLAIAWNVTGNEAYARKAIEVMNAWARTLQSHTDHNAPLQSGWSGAIWPVAGEIIRHTYGGWAPDDLAAFSAMLKNVYLPTVIKGSGGNGNWELVMIEAAAEIGVFLDDRATFDRAVAMWRKRVPAYMYISSDGAHPPPAPTGNRGDTPEAIKSFWYNIGMYVDGVSQETCRDFGHAEYGIASSIAVAETAFQQGLDLYAEHSARLRAAMELHAEYTLGKPVPSWLCGGKLNTRLMPTWEIGYNHFHNRMGIELPQSLKLIEARIRGLDGANKHMVWETLTHAGVGWAGLK